VFNVPFGLPVAVVCCKTDRIRAIEKIIPTFTEAEQHYIQIYLRKACLDYGAALVYASVKKDTNIDLLVDYIEHRLFDFEFHNPPQLLEKESIFVPSGWDTAEKVKFDFTTIDKIRIEDGYDKIVPRPTIIKRKEPVFVAESDQEFLLRHKTAIDQEEPPKPLPFTNLKPSLPRQPSKTDVFAVQNLSRTRSHSMSAAPPKPTALASKDAQPDTKDKQVLADFFASLMSPSKDANNLFSKENASKELDRIKKSINK